MPTEGAIDWTDLDACLQLVQQRAPFANEDEATVLLQMSAGRALDDPDTPVYRPYVVLAHLYETQWTAYRTLRGASGAQLEYRDPTVARDQYLQAQARVDGTFDMIVPPAWPAITGSVMEARW